ncbi:MAG: CocE/NonD family hydrolase [Sphingobacterium sp.]|jgi:putative CocE/NonD family hydrolase|nr:CocE/NonD family hydrolase [Sphingobacterium sp.]
MKIKIWCIWIFVCAGYLGYGQNTSQDSVFIKDNYAKREVYVTMRDGVRLYTTIYEPKDNRGQYPIMMIRTPYSSAPYGEMNFRVPLGPHIGFAWEKFIFVYQDVRGKYKSEGDFIANRPYTKDGNANEVTDTYDTIDWLVGHLTSNGKVGIWGISSPGMYASMSLIQSHPALKAVSPQAPVTDWFLGDDRHHNGAFMLMGSFSFLSSFGKQRDSISTSGPKGFRDYNTEDSYQFYLKTGALKNFNTYYLKGESILWNEMMDNPNYTQYWKDRTYLQHINTLGPAVLVVGGWYDQEDLYGPLKTYRALSKVQKEQVHFVMGPWYHGSWTRGTGRYLDSLDFGQNTSDYFRSQIELPFFVRQLKDREVQGVAPISIFVTGDNKWVYPSAWPPEDHEATPLYLHTAMKLSFEKPTIKKNTFQSYTADPNNPVRYTRDKTVFRGFKYMYEDQYFASQRPDVLVFETMPLDEDVCIMGNIQANLFVSTTGTDADFVVKLIDVYPYEKGNKLSDSQSLVRADVMRAKYRNSFEYPEPLKPNQVTAVSFDMQDAAHVFKKGHKIMVHIQSSWFPLVDRNPQKFVDIYTADDRDFEKQEHRIYMDQAHPSHIILPIISKK